MELYVNKTACSCKEWILNNKLGKVILVAKYIFKDFILFLGREEGEEKERGKHIHVWLPLTGPLLGTCPAT